MKYKFVLVILFSLFVIGCSSPTNESISEDPEASDEEITIDDLKGLIEYIPDDISLDPTEDTSSLGISRGIGDDDLSGGFNFNEITGGMLTGYQELIVTSIDSVRTNLEASTSLEMNEVFTEDRVLTMSSNVPGTTTMNKYKYLINNSELIIWINSTLDAGSWKLDIDCKINIVSSGYSALVSFYQYDQNLEDEYDSSNYDYWSISQDSNTSESILLEIVPGQIEFYTRNVNSDGKYDLFYDRNNTPPEVTDQDGRRVILNRADGLYLSEYHDNTVDGIAIFGTNLAFIGKTIDTTPFTFGSKTDISLSTYLTHWPMDYSTLRDAHAALLVTKEAEARDSITAGTFFPHSEFADL